jgi:hypothetical protein
MKHIFSDRVPIQVENLAKMDEKSSDIVIKTVMLKRKKSCVVLSFINEAD